MSQSISQIKNKETHTLVLGSSEDGSIRTFTFIEHSVSQKGWAKLRLVRLEDSIQIPGLPLVTEYDPAVHDGACHYMSFLWPARSIKRGGEKHYSLYGAFGEPGQRLSLERVNAQTPESPS